MSASISVSVIPGKNNKGSGSVVPYSFLSSRLSVESPVLSEPNLEMLRKEWICQIIVDFMCVAGKI